MGVLTNKRIIEYLDKKKLVDRLVITPLLNPSESIDSASVNVRLGNEFIVMKKQTVAAIDIAKGEDLFKNISKYQQKIRIDYKEQFILHPNQLVIGSTLEYLSIPKTLMCYVVGKSTWGRTGLIIATATKVDPGFKGCITLEIINEGEVPIVLYPGIPIAQLVFHELTDEGDYKGKYKHAVGPEFPKFIKESEIHKFWFDKDSHSG